MRLLPVPGASIMCTSGHEIKGHPRTHAASQMYGEWHRACVHTDMRATPRTQHSQPCTWESRERA
eukprot:14643485-Alexandrium_andersonii.AAC.1